MMSYQLHLDPYLCCHHHIFLGCCDLWPVNSVNLGHFEVNPLIYRDKAFLFMSKDIHYFFFLITAKLLLVLILVKLDKFS